MKSALILPLILLLAAAPSPLRAQIADPKDHFFQAYMSFQHASKLQRDNRLDEALAKYEAAASLLEELKQGNPDWQPLVVEYRLRKTSGAIKDLRKQLAIEQVTSTGQLAAEPPLPEKSEAPTVAIAPPVPPQPADATFKIEKANVLDMTPREIRAHIEQIEAELSATRGQLQKEREERMEQSKILDQTREQLKTALGKISKSEMAEAELRAQLDDARRRLAQAETGTAAGVENQKVLREEVMKLQQRLLAVEAERDLAEDENREMMARLVDANAAVSKLTEERDAIAAERDKALQELAAVQQAREEADRLIEENTELLAKLQTAEDRIRELETSGADGAQVAQLQAQVSDLQEELAQAQQRNVEYETSIADLQQQLDDTSGQLTQMQLDAPRKEFAMLEEENTVLRQIITREMQDQARRQEARDLLLEEMKKAEADSEIVQQQIELLAQPTLELSEEEAALLRETEVEARAEESIEPELPQKAEEPRVTIEIAREKSDATTPVDTVLPPATPEEKEEEIPAIPAELRPLAEEAQRLFENGSLREAEKKYEELLEKAPNNAYALSNLGVVRFRSGKLTAAELTFKKVLALNAEDAFALSTLGIVYFRQGRLEEATNVLTKALALDPKNAIAHNYLGITASRRGWPEAAEEELLAAIALDPDYADAHFNLAVIYATQDPPVQELARRHYDQALNLGAPPDQRLEQMITAAAESQPQGDSAE